MFLSLFADAPLVLIADTSASPDVPHPKPYVLRPGPFNIRFLNVKIRLVRLLS